MSRFSLLNVRYIDEPISTLSMEEIIFREKGSLTRDLLELIKAIEVRYGMMLAPSFSVIDEIA